MTDAQALRRAVKTYKKTVYTPKVPVKTLRAHIDEVHRVTRIPNNVDVHEENLDSVVSDILVPEFAIGQKTMLYAHGGGFIAGSRKSYRNLCASLSHECASRLVLPEYRLAPEYPFPTALEDLYRVYTSLLKAGNAAGDIVFAGDGSGATLVLALAHYARSRKVPMPSGVVLLSPWVDLTCTTPSFSKKHCEDPLYTRDTYIAQALLYTWRENLTNPHVSPLNGDFSFFPNTYVQCGDRDILIDDARALASRLEREHVTCRLDIQEGMWHLFQAADALTPHAHRAVQRIGAWVRGGMQ